MTQSNIPRKYFSGGVNLAALSGNVKTDSASTGVLQTTDQTADLAMNANNDRDVIVNIQLSPSAPNLPVMDRRSFLKAAGITSAAIVLFDPQILLAQELKNLGTDRVQAYLKYFSDNANPVTGFSISHFGDGSSLERNGALTYDPIFEGNC